LADTGQSTPPQTASGLISLAFSHYSSAVSLLGSIQMTQTASGHEVHTRTDLAYVRPNKMYLRQVQSSPSKSVLVTSDGTYFSYDPPEGLIDTKRLVEAVRTPYLYHEIQDIWLAAQLSAPDPNPILLIAIGRKGDLIRLTKQWTAFSLSGKKTIGQESVNVVIGKYRDSETALPTGSFELDINDQGDIRAYQVKESYTVPGHAEMAPIEITTQWAADLTVDAKPDDSMFRVIR